MAQASANLRSPVSRTTPLHIVDRPVDFQFSFQNRQSRLGASASVGAHLAFVVVAFLAIRFAPTPDYSDLVPDDPIKDIVWLAEPGPGGGGGGGNKMPDPPRKAEAPGKQKITVPVEEKPVPKPDPPKNEPPPIDQLILPAKPLADADVVLPGGIQTTSVSDSLGSGTGKGAGPGTGSGLGPGHGGGIGGGAYRPGAGITVPRLIRDVKPQYTADAMRAKVQGSVWLECIVGADGSIGDVRVTRSLDPIFGLDQEAIKAAKQWRFTPGMRLGEPVPVIITIELTFTLR